MDYKFIYDEKEYILTEENCEGIFFDEENEVTGLSITAAARCSLRSGRYLAFSRALVTFSSP